VWEAQIVASSSPRVQTISLLRSGRSLAFAEVVELWQDAAEFRDHFLSLLSASPYDAYFWETPPVTAATASRPFEFVLVESTQLSRVQPEPEAFRSQFASTDAADTILTFPNLGGDALLVVPRPLASPLAYAHLAAFVRRAPDAQKHALWKAVGAAMSRRIGERPVWLSTAGLGVYWLHLRLDARPKYYRHQPYRTAV
jgi:hypothetical protein